MQNPKGDRGDGRSFFHGYQILKIICYGELVQDSGRISTEQYNRLGVDANKVTKVFQILIVFKIEIDIVFLRSIIGSLAQNISDKNVGRMNSRFG